jgi:hypothetical protein
VAVALEVMAFAPATVVAVLSVGFAFAAFGIRLSRSAPVPDPTGNPGPAVP